MTEGAEAEQMQVEGPVTPSRALVRRQAIPRELEALGVKVAVDPESEMQILVIPKEMRERFNVLTPVQAFQQADANWRPSLRVVELDPAKDGPHFYEQQGGKLAPRKQALELLADAAGIIERTVQLHGRERVVVGDVQAETFTHLATAKVRKSDGTVSILQASRTYEPYAEYEEIVDAVKGAPANRAWWRAEGKHGDAGEIRKRWLNEIKFAKAKNESKAILRTIRSALQIGHVFTPASAAKPFVVVGWNLSPQDSPEVRAAIAQLYGATPDLPALEAPVSHGWDAPELTEGEVVLEEGAEGTDTSSTAPGQQADAEVPSQAPASAPGSDSPEAFPPQGADAVPHGDTGEQGAPGSETPDPTTPAASTSEPTLPLDVDLTLTDDEQERLPALLKLTLPTGGNQTRTLAWALERGEEVDAWFAWALRQTEPKDETFRAGLAVVMKAHRPEIYSAWREEVGA